MQLVLASGATRPGLGFSEHPLNSQFQGLKVDLCGYCCPNYFSRSAPVVVGVTDFSVANDLFLVFLYSDLHSTKFVIISYLLFTACLKYFAYL